MTKKEMIEEIRLLMCNDDCEKCCKEIAEYSGVTIDQVLIQSCIIRHYAEKLYCAGYRKKN